MDEEKDTYIVFGSPLEPLEVDELPSKRPIQIQDQKVYDENGLQRFHGAFTGGFSAGYFNSVGTKEGWTPSEFVSSRNQKATKNVRRPEDFMDAEDLREFGIAPMRIHAKEQFRKDEKGSSREIDKGPQVIPGAAPLLDIVRPVPKSVGVVLLQKLGWRLGKGIGPRKMFLNSNQKVYGCELPSAEMDTLKEQDFSHTYMVSPSDVNVLPYKAKNNVYGLGYVSLNESGHFSVSSLIAESVSGYVGKGKKKVAFSGQAFGVGAFEDDDEDIYGRDDLSKYDFSLEDEKDAKQVQSRNSKKSLKGDSGLKGFVRSTQSCTFNKKQFPPPVLPPGYVPKNLTVSVSAISTTTLSTGTGRFLNRFAFSAVDRTKMLGNRFADSSNQHQDKSITGSSLKQEKRDSSLDNNLPSPETNRREEKVASPPLKFPTFLSSKFVTSSKLEVEEVAYGLSRPTATLASPKMESQEKAPEHKCQRLIEIWHPVALLCKRFNVPNPYPDSDSSTLQAMASRPSAQKPSIFRSLFEIPDPVPQSGAQVSSSSKDDELISELDSKNNSLDANIPGSAASNIAESGDDVKRADEDLNSRSRNTVPEEDFKPPTPPTMDLFKEIFQDSSSGEADDVSDHSDDEVSQVTKTGPENDFSTFSTLPMKITTEPVSLPSTITPVLPPTESSEHETSFYGPALPPPGMAAAKPTDPFLKVSREDYKSNKHKAKKKKSHHKSHKKHKKKKMRYSKHSSSESDGERDSEDSSASGEGNDKDVNLKLLKRLKEMKKRK